MVFYIHNIFIIFSKYKKFQFLKFEKILLNKFMVNYFGEKSHFLKIKIIKNRPNKKTYLIQNSYISKLKYKFNIVLSKYILKILLLLESLILFKSQIMKIQIKKY